jgi:hypothetical protein
MITAFLIAQNNKELAKKLVPFKSLPIYCNSVIDPRAEVFNQPLKKSKWTKLK